MPIYEYACSACGRRTEILHGINDPTPHFCPECGAEGTLRKGFAAPAVVFKGSGWAKKDRRATSSTKSSDRKDGGADSKTSEQPAADAGAGKSESTESRATDKPSTKASEGA